MAASGKKRTQQQRTGKLGEDAFRKFASTARLLPSRPEEDFGLDFLCMTESTPDRAGTSQIGGSVLGVAVRSSESSRGRIRIKRSDAEHLLRCEFPTCICLVHINDPKNPVLYLSLVDECLGVRLAEFLRGTDKSISLTPSDLLSEADFLRQLPNGFERGFVERVRIQLAEQALGGVVGPARIKLHREASGQLSLVRINNFFGQFDLRDRGVKSDLETAIFGRSEFLEQRLQRLPLNPDLLNAIQRLPHPVVVHGALPAAGEIILSVEGTGISCAFDVRSTDTQTGFVHECGFSLTISARTPHDGHYVHFLETRFDPDVSIDLREHPDLWAFLEACDARAKIVVGDSSVVFPADSFGGLVQLSFFSRYLRQAQEHEVPLDEFALADGMNPECLNTLAWLNDVFGNPKRLEGFVLLHGRSTPGDALERKPLRFALPVVINMPKRAAVTWLECEGDFLRDGKWIVGVHVRTIDSATLELKDRRFDKTDSPEVAVTPDWNTVSLARQNEGSDCTAWGVALVDFDDSEDETDPTDDEEV